MKTLYTFKVKKPSSGEEIELAIRRPTRMEADEADMFYSSAFSDCVSRGIMPKEVMLKHYKNYGGAMSKEEAKKYDKLNHSYYDVIGKLQGEKNQKKRENLEKERDIIWIALSEINSAHERLFSRSADAIAQNKTLLHLTLLLTQEKEGEFFKQLYEGSDFEDRYEFYSEQDEINHEDADTVFNKAFTFVLFWYYSDKKITEKDFQDYERVVFPEEATEEDSGKSDNIIESNS